MQKVFATLAVPGTFAAAAASPPAGRLVANTEFLKAMMRFGSFDRFCFFLGEGGDRDAVDALAATLGPGGDAAARVQVRHLLDLPRAFAEGAVSVFHHASHVERFLDLVWLRDRFAPAGAAAIPVTGQIHSLSYPDLMKDYVRALLHPPGRHDAIFCSSKIGRAS